MQSLPQKNDSYQIYFYTCRAHKPFHVARHPWVVTVSYKKIDRWEIIKRDRDDKQHFGYVYKNYYPNPTQGIKKYPGSSEYWDSALIGQLSGEKGSLAERMVNFIHDYSPDYIHKDNYHIYPGPNSNTYVAWILNKFPESNITLPWNCFGKNYK